jgi:hypothetical protein
MLKQTDTEQILNFIKTNKAITKIDEVMAEFPELSSNIFKNPDITKALENNKIKMQTALKIKLFKSNTTQSLLELNSMLNEETNNDRTSKYISKLVREWASNELQ